MALLSRAATWLSPEWLVPHRPPKSSAPVVPGAVPAWVQHRFFTAPAQLHPLDDTRPERTVAEAALARWQHGAYSALAFIGTFGAGKTTLLRRIALTFPELPLVYHRFTSRILGAGQLLQQLTDSLGLVPVNGIDDLAAHLQAGPKRVILLDDCHLLFLRRPGGFVPLDLLLRLIGSSGQHVLWITTWNVYAWLYLKHVRALPEFFTTVHLISPQPYEEMQQMLLARLQRARLPVTWPAEETEPIFRTIWLRARGRPALAQHIFLRSLQPERGGVFTLHADHIYRPPQQCAIAGGEEIHALENLVRHEVLTARELASINHISEAEAAAILARTTAKGLTLSLEPDYRLNPIYIDAVVAYLDSRRAISFREVDGT